MRFRRAIEAALGSALLTVILACAPPQSDQTPRNEATGAAPAAPIQTQPTLAHIARATIEALADRDFDALAQLAHPHEGVRLSPYAYVEPEQDVVFSAEQMANAAEDETRYRWGYYDGTGKPIDLTFKEYFDRFVYDADFAKAEQVGYNTQIASGNTINNLPDVYPDSVFVEYYFSGFDPQYSGLDWRGLRLVFRRHDGDWRLVGIVHDQWTI